MKSVRLHRTTFVAAGIHNIAWGCYAVYNPQWFFHLTGMAASNTPQIFATLGMVLGLYGILYLEVARVPARGWLIAAVGMTGKVLGPVGLLWLIVTGKWPVDSVVLVSTNDLIWWIPIGLYLKDAWPWFLRDLQTPERDSSAAWPAWAGSNVREWDRSGNGLGRCGRIAGRGPGPSTMAVQTPTEIPGRDTCVTPERYQSLYERTSPTWPETRGLVQCRTAAHCAARSPLPAQHL
ncbi:hypothetical protein ACFWP5_18850 [Streptomyces sp. NPDC058469]|uniref:hypothetical protein n=1 Tax=Streptomyces sp. NPDC058469 TaxID=3346514 RepID=UPI0036686ADA